MRCTGQARIVSPYGHLDCIYKGINNNKGATIFGYQVRDPQRYGVIEFDVNGKAISIEEKPKVPKSNYAVPGIYIYNNSVIRIAKSLTPSARGELEITDVNKAYLQSGELQVEKISRGIAWLDTGTPDALLKASNFFGLIEERQGLKVGCLEEIAYNKKFINRKNLEKLITQMPNSTYRDYLQSFLKTES